MANVASNSDLGIGKRLAGFRVEKRSFNLIRLMVQDLPGWEK